MSADAGAGAALGSGKLSAALGRQFPQIDVGLLRLVLSQFFWTWYEEHQNDTVLQRKILVFRVTLKVRDAYPLFQMLFGLPTTRVG